jgi:hypothetical protein
MAACIFTGSVSRVSSSRTSNARSAIILEHAYQTARMICMGIFWSSDAWLSGRHFAERPSVCKSGHAKFVPQPWFRGLRAPCLHMCDPDGLMQGLAIVLILVQYFAMHNHLILDR